jgi:hypothetical protein
VAVLAVVGAGEAVLARLVHAVGHEDLDGDVLAGQRGLDQPVVDAADDEGDDVAVSRILLSTCHGRHTVSGRTPQAL